MTLRTRTVTIVKMPNALDRDNEKQMLDELEMALKVERPAIVLDCSELRQMDYSAVHLLLLSLENAMKRNGDVRLAALSGHAKEVLQAMSLDRLFRMFKTKDEAVESFRRRAAFAAAYVPGGAPQASETAA